MNVRFLGTSASRPTVERNVASLALEREGGTMLFDCGEGTQRQMMRYRVSFALGDVFFTHFHADHVIGIIGLGRIGSRIAKLMRPWGMKMIGYDPYVPDSKFVDFGVERIKDLSTLLRQSDVVTLHVVLTKETRHMISAAQFAMMKPTAVLVNTSRGFCVDEKALIEALQKNKIAGAALDVFEYEPLAAESPLRKMDDRVLISPHMISSNLGSGL